MFKPYAFSLDREEFSGEYATREQAVEAGLRAAEKSARVEAVFVARRAPVDPQADRHAEDVAKQMRRRMRDKTGDAGYLKGVNEHVLADLDAAIEHAVVDWLRRHNLTPAPRFTAISEHPVPTVAAHGPSEDDEVSLIGPDEA